MLDVERAGRTERAARLSLAESMLILALTSTRKLDEVTGLLLH